MMLQTWSVNHDSRACAAHQIIHTFEMRNVEVGYQHCTVARRIAHFFASATAYMRESMPDP